VLSQGFTCRGDRRSPGVGAKPPLAIMRGENISAPACAMTRIQRSARATAGRPYSEHRAYKHYDHPGPLRKNEFPFLKGPYANAVTLLIRVGID